MKTGTYYMLHITSLVILLDSELVSWFRKEKYRSKN